jgi:hypothetical protein
MLSHVSIEGADDSISPVDMCDISFKYPFAEWTINIEDGAAKAGFPSLEWLESLYKHRGEVTICGRIHGRWKRDILSLKEENPKIWSLLSKVETDSLYESYDLIHKRVIMRSCYPIGNDLLLPGNLDYKKPCGFMIDKSQVSKFLSKKNPNYWLSISGFCDNTVDLLSIEKTLDIIEDSIDSDSWFDSLLNTDFAKQRMSVML